MRKIVLLFVGLFLIITSCSEEDPLPLDPGIATLISPINQETCFDGVSINDTQSNVEFSWSAASDAISYELIPLIQIRLPLRSLKLNLTAGMLRV
jgi:hypothetical protein